MRGHRFVTHAKRLRLAAYVIESRRDPADRLALVDARHRLSASGGNILYLRSTTINSLNSIELGKFAKLTTLPYAHPYRSISRARFRREIANKVVERDQFGVVRFRNIHRQFAMQPQEKVEPIHGVEMYLIAQRLCRIERARRDFGRDRGQRARAAASWPA
jgi:hypothetical protein